MTEALTVQSDDIRIYFAYGSNLSVRRLKERVSSAKPLGMGWLPEHRLMFHKKSQDGSGKCDIVPSRACTVFGVLFEIDFNEKEALDKYEGVDHGYLTKACKVQVGEGRCIPAFTYHAAPTHVDDNLKPYSWYLNHVIIGAEEASLLETYVQEVRSTESIQDTDHKREKRERRLYEQGESARWRQPEHALEHPRLVNCEPSRILGREACVE